MKYLFDKDGIQALEAFCMAKTLFAFDYDGTLAPIVDDPTDAIMRRKTYGEITQLALLTPVALISGRARDDLARLAPKEIDFMIGNHGLEGLPGGSPSLEQAEISCNRWSEILSKQILTKGVVIENKRYSLAVHYRMASDKRKARSTILDLAASLSPAPRIVLGKCVVNLVSPGAPHKGVALLEVMLRSECRSAVYIGDDDNDEDVFRLGEESLLTIRVGKEEGSASLYYINSQDEIDRVLSLCTTGLQKAGKVRRDIKSLRGIADGFV